MAAHLWQEAEHEPQFLAAWEAHRARVHGTTPPPVKYRHPDGRVALVGREAIAEGDERWHISVSAPGRVPSWSEVAATAHELRPGVVFALGVPPRSWWLNAHPHVLHLWEIQDVNLEAQWRREGRGHTPS